MLCQCFISRCDADDVLYAELAHSKPGFIYTGCLGSSSQHIGFVRYVVWRSYPFDLIEEATDVSMYFGRGRALDILSRRVHEVKFALPFHSLCGSSILPYCGDSVRYLRIERCLWIGVDVIFFNICYCFLCPVAFWLDLELLHSRKERLHAVDQVLIDRKSVQRPFFLRVSILVYDFHLLHDR